MWRVIKVFTDLQDNNHAYGVGDIYPRAGLEVSEKRLEELSSSKNRQGTPLIKEVKGEPKEESKKKPTKKKGKE